MVQIEAVDGAPHSATPIPGGDADPRRPRDILGG
jgi:hypothetical protein